ncbi:hypothetical protein Wcon_01253 [Wolbachia endosymbiont of Cylisticus convexus]|uniref:hypothetical protein n=1 Tax=Wolbachia endosymbiont of Cylisticus convexus TaxID=118728 RepID=UPI000E13ABAF|nr:hypothetical protein [Wolbachia endosymbiont of Cylisticus convexus]RDD34649.1 hypothetical protein Wcon_01253 [Wolbachia endosymbiont of Cylisticus convexus]
MKKDDVIGYSATLVMVATIGALTGLGLSFTGLSPLVMGGIVGSITPALYTALCAGILLYGFCKKDSIKKENKDDFFNAGIATLASAASGVVIAAATMAIFPGAGLGMGSAALAGAVIGVMAPMALIAAAFAIEKVNDYIISPIVERFSSKEEKSKLPQHVCA